MEFSKDEVKDKVIWTKGTDFTDGSPRYTFEGRDPATTYERFQVVIYTERERRYASFCCSFGSCSLYTFK